MAGKILNEQLVMVNVLVRPYFVTNSAFALSLTILKGYPRPIQLENKPFIDAVISARKTDEMGFGQAKKFYILMKGGLSALHTISCVTTIIIPPCKMATIPRPSAWNN